MIQFALAYLALTCLFFLPLACSVQGIPLSYEDGQPDTAYALQRQLGQAMDSLRALDTLPAIPRCIRVWSHAQADSVWDCPDPRPPAPMKKGAGALGLLQSPGGTRLRATEG